MFESLRDGPARSAFLRTLRTVVDLRGQVVTMLDRCYLAQGMPTLLVWGRRDAVIPVDHGEEAHRAMPGSRLVVFEDAGHFPHRSDPARFNTLVREFLRSTQPAAYSSEQWRALLRSGGPKAQPALPRSGSAHGLPKPVPA
jgi:pimeloyl-ACP methyl ester carboxylesterase